MSIPSNSYAEKVFAEHPIGLWTLDEPVHFISLINNKIKKLIIGSGSGEWTITGATASEDLPEAISIPIKDSPTKSFLTNSETVSLTSDYVFALSDLDTNKNTFNISFYFNSFASNIESITVGYTDDTTPVSQSFLVSPDDAGQWQFISATFDIPTTSDDLKITISISHETVGSNIFIINGLSVGQWSENFSSVNTGITVAASSQTLPDFELIDLPNTIDLPSSKAVAALAYGFGIDNGYYLASENKLYAYNDGVPLVFGATGTTKILPREDNLPSLIIPSLGFMGAVGQYQDLTLEMWTRIVANTIEPKRILGPLNSTDGLYVDGSFLTFKLADNVATYQVGEWNRPMLLHIRIANNSASVLINGEQVMSLSVDRDVLNFLPKLTEDGKDQEFIGFYSYSDASLEVDCISVYPYSVPELLAKKRFVYGQGVETPRKTKGNVNSYTAAIDYKFANYSNNYIYPDTNHWNRGIQDNIKASKGSISTPEYVVPRVFYNSSITEEQWFQLCKESNDVTPGKNFVSLDLGNRGFLFFEKFNFLQQEKTTGFYGLFKIVNNTNDEQILFKILDPVTKNCFEIVFDNNEVIYRFINAGISKTLYSEQQLIGVEFFAGIEIDKFIKTYGSGLSSFFANGSRLTVFIGGESSSTTGNVNIQIFTRLMSGNIYNLSFLNKRNLNKIKQYFSSNGVIISDDVFLAISDSNIIFVDGGFAFTTTWENEIDGGTPSSILPETPVIDGGSGVDITIDQTIVNHTATYSLLPSEYLDTFKFDIATDSYWQDYVPLKFFAKYVENQDGDRVYGLDYLQFNIDHPRLNKYIENNYDTSNAKIKTYISFQYVASGANTTAENLDTVSLSKTNVIIPGTEWADSKYEINNDTIIYLPPAVNFETLALVIHIDLTSTKSIDQPNKIKYMHIAGQSLNRNKPTPVNTKFGVQLYPYYKSGVYPVYNAKNPVNIYKQSTPHLYLTENSGIELKDLNNSSANRGIQIQINSNKLDEYSVGSIQLAMRYQKEEFSSTPKKMFEILCRHPISNAVFNIDIWSQSSSQDNRRGKIYATYGSLNTPYDGIRYFHNGRFTNNLNILSQEWNIITFQFYPPIEFGSNGANFTGQFNIVDNVLVNNIAVYQGPEIDTFLNLRRRYWSEINGNYNTWQEVLDDELTWFDVYYDEFQQIVTVDAIETHNDYTRSNRFVIEDGTYTVLGDYKYALYSDVAWKRIDVAAV